MEKISGILPSTPRVTTVDIESSLSARPGAFSLGRPKGVSNGQRNSIIRSAHATISNLANHPDVRSKDQKHVDIVKNMSDGFFKRKEQVAQEEMLVDEILSAEYLQKAPAAISANLNEISQLEMEMGQPTIGRYLNVEV